MSLSVAKLHALSDDELIRLHDEAARHTVVGIAYYLDEIRRREQLAMMRSNQRLARASFWLSVASTVLAAVAAVAAVVAIARP